MDHDLAFRLLGPLEVSRAGAVVDVGAGHQAALLALLVVNAGRVVAVDRVLDELWDGSPPPSAFHAVQVYVSQLRKALEPDRPQGAPPAILVTRRPGYLVNVADGCYDAHHFEAATASARSALAEGDPGQASRLFDEALGLWRGEPFAGIAEHRFLSVEAARLDGLRLAAIEDRCEANLALGRHRELVPELQGLVDVHPLRERLWGQLMVALYRSGRQADALAAFQRCRALLVDELGVEPGPDLSELERAILRHDPAIAVPADRGRPAAPLIESPAESPPASPDPPAEDELRLVTILDAGIVGLAALDERLDAGERSLVVSGAIDLMAGAAKAFGGTVRLRSSGILAWFGVPTAHEDDAERALLAGLRMVDELANYGDEVGRSWDVQALGAAVGIETGQLIVRATGEGQVAVEGVAVERAGERRASAGGGMVLAGLATRSLAAGRFDWGVAGPTGGVPVRGRRHGAVDDRLGGPLVGRGREVREAMSALEEVMEGTGGIVLIGGQAGLGKTRLVAGLRQRFLGANAGTWLEGRGVSYGSALAYWAFREMLREWLGASPNHPALRTRIELRRRLLELVPDDVERLYRLLADVLGVGVDHEAGNAAELMPASLQAATFDAIGVFIERLSDRGPVVVALDDLHWADATSLDLLGHLLASTERTAVLLILSSRPEPSHPSWALRERARREYGSMVHDIELQPLEESAAARLLESLTGTDPLAEPLARAVMAAADGNPFFLEELVLSVSETGGESIHVPDTIENVILSRIDRLPGEARRVLSAAATLGRQFEFAHLAGVCGPDLDIDGATVALERHDLLRLARRWPNREYRFKHPLIQQVAHNMLPADRRRELHRRAARVLETEYADRPAESPGLLAHHWQEAGDAQRALPYCLLAAQGARQAYALDETVRHCTAGLEMAGDASGEGRPAVLAKLRLWRAEAWQLLSDHRSVAESTAAIAAARVAGDLRLEAHALQLLGMVETLERGGSTSGSNPLVEAVSVARRAGDTGREVSAQNVLAIFHTNRLELDQAVHHAEAALSLARKAGDPALICHALDGRKLVAFALGDIALLQETTAELLPQLRARRDIWLLQFALAEGALVPTAAGKWEQAEHQLDEALAINRGFGRDYRAYLLALRSWFALWRGHVDIAVETGRQAVQAVQAASTGSYLWIAWSSSNLGAALLAAGDVDGATKELGRGLAGGRRGGIGLQAVRCESLLAAAELLAGTPRRPELVPSGRPVGWPTSAPRSGEPSSMGPTPTRRLRRSLPRQAGRSRARRCSNLSEPSPRPPGGRAPTPGCWWQQVRVRPPLAAVRRARRCWRKRPRWPVPPVARLSSAWRGAPSLRIDSSVLTILAAPAGGSDEGTKS